MISWGAPDLLAVLASSWLPSPRQRRARAAAAVSAVAGLMACAWLQVGLWADGANLFEHSLDVAGESDTLENALGITLFERGRTGEAIAHYRSALTINAAYPEARNNLAEALRTIGDLSSAELEAREAVRLRPSAANHTELGTILSHSGRLAEAAAEFDAALRLDPNYLAAYNNFGILLARQGRFDDAIERFAQALSIDPTDAAALKNMQQALALRRGGRERHPLSPAPGPVH